MKVKDFLKALTKLMEENPDCANMPVVYSIDDEGNQFKEVKFNCCIGYFANDGFLPDSQTTDSPPNNAVCIN